MIIPKNIQDLISELRRDNTHGAAELVQKASQVLEQAAQIREASVADARARLVAVSKALVNAQRSMAPILNLVNEALGPLQNAQSAEELSASVQQRCKDFSERVRKSTDRLAHHALHLLDKGMTVLTHSKSSAVFRAITLAHENGKSCEVICTESRPMNEGVDLARALSTLGLKVTLITDASVFSFVRRCDVVLVGADAVSAHGVVNKIGTASLGEAARLASVPLYVLAGTEKFLSPSIPLSTRELKNPEEVLGPAVSNITAVNLYFDVTPLDRFTGGVTEEGMVKAPELQRRLAEWKADEILDLEACG